jgi:hypothetical protein
MATLTPSFDRLKFKPEGFFIFFSDDAQRRGPERRFGAQLS